MRTKSLASVPTPFAAVLAAHLSAALASQAMALPEISSATAAGGDLASYRGSSGHIQLSPPHVARGPEIDGRLDDEVWRQAAVLDSFTQNRPIEGVRDTLGTTCLVMYDDQNLYVFSNIHRMAIWANAQRFRTVRGGLTYVFGDQVVFAEAVAGHDRYYEVWADLRFSSQFDGSLNVADRMVWREDGSQFAEAFIPRLRLSYQFSKELALRWITELRSRHRYDAAGALVSDTRTLNPDVLMSYALRPGTAVYLGYGSFLDGQEVGALKPRQNSLFTKVSYLWQL